MTFSCIQSRLKSLLLISLIHFTAGKNRFSRLFPFLPNHFQIPRCYQVFHARSGLDHRQSPAGGCPVGTRADECQLCWMPATLYHFVTVFGNDDARQPLHQITCRIHHTHRQHTHVNTLTISMTSTRSNILTIAELLIV